MDHPAYCGQECVLYVGSMLLRRRICRPGVRAAAEYAGTARSHRGRGLATLAKLASTRAARDAGVERITTENDVENAPMLAINRRLGFEPGEELHQYARVL